MEIVKELKKKIESLEKENSYLKSLLIKAGISFETGNRLDANIQNQGALIIPQTEFTDKEMCIRDSYYIVRIVIVF